MKKKIEPKYISCHSSIRLIEKNIIIGQSGGPVALVHVFEQLIRVNPLMGKADRSESYLLEHIVPLVSKQCSRKLFFF